MNASPFTAAHRKCFKYEQIVLLWFTWKNSIYRFNVVLKTRDKKLKKYICLLHLASQVTHCYTPDQIHITFSLFVICARAIAEWSPSVLTLFSFSRSCSPLCFICIGDVFTNDHSINQVIVWLFTSRQIDQSCFSTFFFRKVGNPLKPVIDNPGCILTLSHCHLKPGQLVLACRPNGYFLHVVTKQQGVWLQTPSPSLLDHGTALQWDQVWLGKSWANAYKVNWWTDIMKQYINSTVMPEYAIYMTIHTTISLPCLTISMVSFIVSVACNNGIQIILFIWLFK